jgi:hypothetical protein
MLGADHSNDLETNMAEVAVLDSNDLRRVAAFYDGDIGQAYLMARDVWLPDAERTLERIGEAVRGRNDGSLAFLCDHLREGARCVGARDHVRVADCIEAHCRQREFGRIGGELRKAAGLTESARSWLQRRCARTLTVSGRGVLLFSRRGRNVASGFRRLKNAVAASLLPRAIDDFA